MAGAGQAQEFRSTGVHEYHGYKSMYIIQDNKYRIHINVIITGQVLT